MLIHVKEETVKVIFKPFLNYVMLLLFFSDNKRCAWVYNIVLFKMPDIYLHLSILNDLNGSYCNLASCVFE